MIHEWFETTRNVQKLRNRTRPWVILIRPVVNADRSNRQGSLAVVLSGLSFIGGEPSWIGCRRASQGVTFRGVGSSLPSGTDAPYQESDEDEHHGGCGVSLPFALRVNQGHKDESGEERGDPVPATQKVRCVERERERGDG